MYISPDRGRLCCEGERLARWRCDREACLEPVPGLRSLSAVRVRRSDLRVPDVDGALADDIPHLRLGLVRGQALPALLPGWPAQGGAGHAQARTRNGGGAFAPDHSEADRAEADVKASRLIVSAIVSTFVATSRPSSVVPAWSPRWSGGCGRRGSPLQTVAREVRAFVEALYAAGSVDQLNVGGLRLMEHICRRIAVIVEAYAVPGRPMWDTARFYSGAAPSEEVIAPALRTMALKKANEEHEMQAARARNWVRGAPSKEGDGEADGASAAGSRIRGVGRGAREAAAKAAPFRIHEHT